RQAIKHKPDLLRAHYNLGIALESRGRIDEAAGAYRRVLDLKPDYAEAHYDLGNTLLKKGRYDQATDAYRRAVDLKPHFAEAHCNLGLTLRQQGEFAKALTALQQGHKLGSRRPDWPYPSAQWVRECHRLVELEERQEAILAREAK